MKLLTPLCLIALVLLALAFVHLNKKVNRMERSMRPHFQLIAAK